MTQAILSASSFSRLIYEKTVDYLCKSSSAIFARGTSCFLPNAIKCTIYSDRMSRVGALLNNKIGICLS